MLTIQMFKNKNGLSQPADRKLNAGRLFCVVFALTMFLETVGKMKVRKVLLSN